MRLGRHASELAEQKRHPTRGACIERHVGDVAGGNCGNRAGKNME
jgi:hypothetical protein